MSGLELRNIVKNFGAVEVIRDVSLSVNDGEFIAFVGPSGCGKSTLLRLIAGLDKPTGGSIAIDGKDVTEIGAADRGLAMVFQSYALYPHMSVRKNLAFGLENLKFKRAEIEALIARYSPYSDEREQFSAALYGTSEVLKIDGEGRVILTEPLKTHAGIKDEVACAGLGHKFQIWEPGRFRAELAEATEKVRALKKQLGSRVAAEGPHGARE